MTARSGNRLKVRLQRFQFVGRREDSETGGGYADAQPAAPSGQATSYQEAPASSASNAPSATEDDIPF